MSPPVGSGAEPWPKRDFSAFNRQILLVVMFVVNEGPVRRRLLTENHAFGRLEGDSPSCPPPVNPP